MKMDFPTEENRISYRGKWNFPGRNREIHRNFDFILPKFYIPDPWRIFVSQRGIGDFFSSFAKLTLRADAL